MIYPPHDSPELLDEVFPLYAMPAYTQWCKYCWDTHRQWWMMDQKDYQIESITVILCGICEHTSAQERFDVETTHDLP